MNADIPAPWLTDYRAAREAIFEYVEHHNDRTNGYRWKALPEAILAKVRRARAVLDNTPTT